MFHRISSLRFRLAARVAVVAAVVLTAAPLVTGTAASADPDTPTPPQISRRHAVICAGTDACIFADQTSDIRLDNGVPTVHVDLIVADAPVHSQQVLRLQLDGYTLSQGSKIIYSSTATTNNGGKADAQQHFAAPVTISNCLTVTPVLHVSARLRNGTLVRYAIDGGSVVAYVGQADCPFYTVLNPDSANHHCLTAGNHDCVTDALYLTVARTTHTIFAGASTSVTGNNLPSNGKPSDFNYQRVVRIQIDDVQLLRGGQVVAHAPPTNSGTLWPTQSTTFALSSGVDYGNDCSTFQVRALWSYRYADGTIGHSSSTGALPDNCPPDEVR